MLDWWASYIDREAILVVYGGRRADFEALTHPHATFVDDARFLTPDDQRDKQSHGAVIGAAARWLASTDFEHLLYTEYDQVPVAADLIARYERRLADEDADLLGLHLRRVDATSYPDFLYHADDPAFRHHWLRTSVRAEKDVVLSMLSTGSFWRRECLEAVAANADAVAAYTELFVPTCAHHLGFRVRGLADQGRWNTPLGGRGAELAAAAAAGAWTVHPVKTLWGDSPGPSRLRDRLRDRLAGAAA